MALTIDPQIGAGMMALFGDGPMPPPPAAGDVETRRASFSALFAGLAAAQPPTEGVTVQDFATQAKDGHEILLRWYTPRGEPTGSGVYYIHGGGMIVGSVGEYDETVKRYVKASGVPFLSVEYRLAPEHPDPTPVEDCYAGLVWFAENARRLGVDPDRIAVMGDSAGGGLAAGLALLARDRGGPPIARQILVYPMVDDTTTTPDEAIAPFATWSYDDNITGWSAYLGSASGTDKASIYAAPARAKDLSGLPPAYIDVGDLDIFRDEDVAYATRLIAAGVPTELHVHPGCPHGFELFAADADVSKRTMADRVRQISLL